MPSKYLSIINLSWRVKVLATIFFYFNVFFLSSDDSDESMAPPRSASRRKPENHEKPMRLPKTNQRKRGAAVKVSFPPFLHSFFFCIWTMITRRSLSFADDIYDYGILSHSHRVVAAGEYADARRAVAPAEGRQVTSHTRGALFETSLSFPPPFFPLMLTH